jgi:arginyl-tRNA synthetase
MRAAAVEIIMGWIREDLGRLGVAHDVFTSERALVDTIMQPFMGNQAWAELVTPKPSPEPPGALAVAAGDPWLAGEAYMTASFLSGLS